MKILKYGLMVLFIMLWMVSAAKAVPLTNWDQLSSISGTVDQAEFTGSVAGGNFEANIPPSPNQLGIVDIVSTVEINNNGVDGIIVPGGFESGGLKERF